MEGESEGRKTIISESSLTSESTPCEICVAMTVRLVELNKSRTYSEKGSCGVGDAVTCVDADKARIRLGYLSLRSQTAQESYLVCMNRRGAS